LFGSIFGFYTDILSSYNKNLETTKNKINGIEYLKKLHKLSFSTISYYENNNEEVLHNNNEEVLQNNLESLQADINNIYDFQKMYPKFINPVFNKHLKSLKQSIVNRNTDATDYFDFLDYINHENYIAGNRAELLFINDKKRYLLGTLLTHYLPEFHISLGISDNILDMYAKNGYINDTTKNMYIEQNKLVFLSSEEVGNIINLLDEYSDTKHLAAIIKKIDNVLEQLNKRGSIFSNNTNNNLDIYQKTTHKLLYLSEELNTKNTELLENILKQDEKYFSDKLIFYRFLLIFIFFLVTSLFIYFFYIFNLSVKKDSKLKQLNVSLMQKIKELDAAKEIAVTANKTKSKFLSSMSHELRTPLNAVLGFAQILKYDDMLDDEQQDSVQEILQAGALLLELINEILDLAKIESGKINLSLEPVELTPLVDECFKLINPMAKKHGISISYNDINDHFIRADRIRLKQVLLNLLSNAIKYNREQGTVVLDASPFTGKNNKNKIQITITDTGKGIAKEDLNELFQPFNRLNAESSGIEGTGIGLSITRNLVEIMGGRINVDSELNIGSRFCVEFPVEKYSGYEQEHDTDEDVIKNPPIAKVLQHTILYIEDNPANLKLVSRILAGQADINLITAHEANLGLKLASTHRPELILLDINMPIMDGYQVLSVLKLDEQLKGIPVIAVTANAMPKDIERGKAAGFSDYLTKPINIEKFISMLNYYLKK